MRVLIFGEELSLRGLWRVARAADHSVAWVGDPATLIEQARSIRPQVVLFDYSHAGPAAPLLFGQLTRLLPKAKVIVLALPSPPDNPRHLFETEGFTHLIPLDKNVMDRVAATLARIDGADPFGLRWHFGRGAHVVQIGITGSERSGALAGIETYLKRMGIGGRICPHIQTAADEMLMNAIYDAPVDRASGTPLHGHKPRSEKISLAVSDRPTFKIASDGRFFGMAVCDPFGALKAETVKRYIAKGLRRGADQMDQKAGGAGLGLYVLFDHLSQMTVNIEPGVRTEFVGLVDIRGSYRAQLTAPKAFEIFTV